MAVSLQAERSDSFRTDFELCSGCSFVFEVVLITAKDCCNASCFGRVRLFFFRFPRPEQ